MVTVCTKLSCNVNVTKQRTEWLYDLKTVVLYLCLKRTKYVYCAQILFTK
jgi:hypothetical protein